MRRRSLVILSLLFVGLLCVMGSLALRAPDNVPVAPATKSDDANLPNPAAVHCEEKGFRLESRTAPNGSQAGICMFPDGTECEEWAYFRGECHPGTPAPDTENKAIEATRILLSKQLNVDINLISVYSLEQIRWPDSCLGIPVPGEACQPAEVPGFRVILTAGKDHFTYHTDLTGENIRLETAGTHGG